MSWFLIEIVLILLHLTSLVSTDPHIPDLHEDQQILGAQTPTLSAMASPVSAALNVLKQPLALHSKNPVTGFLRDGYCQVPASDYGNHAIAATVSQEFLDFSKAQGNDLTSVVSPGCKWCLCATRWLEAFQARGSHKDGDKIVPRYVTFDP